MDSKNLLRLTDDIEDPILDLRRALSEVVDAAQRTIGRALESSPVRDVARSLLKPRIKVADNEHEIVVSAELPGIPPESVAVTLHPESVLRIEVGSRRRSSGKSSTSTDAGRHLGIRPLARSIALPRNVDRDRATAVFENGQLTVKVPKLKEPESAVAKIATKAA